MDLVGRARELETILQLISSGERLLTLSGPPGIGKTSLAVAAARQVQHAFADGTAIVELATLTDSGLVLTAIANALRIADRGDVRLEDALADRHLLLVLDNAEHVRAAGSQLAALLAACPRVQLLVTSRAPLHVDAERIFGVERLAPRAAQTLFAVRAVQARAEFQVTAANAAVIGQICDHLEGMPLAIELAAARIQVLSAEQIARRLDDSFSLLATRHTDRPERHRALHVALDWSYRLLSDSERTLLRRMSVFAGDAALEAVRDVCSGTPEGLASLVDHSLVTLVDQRYRLLEPVRQFALQRLRAAGEVVATRERHAAYVLRMAEAAEPELLGDSQPLWLERLQRDYPNLRQAIRWCLDRHQPEPALRLSAALWKFCEVRGHAREGAAWLHAALALDSAPSTARSKALHGAACLAFVCGDYAHAERLDEENLALRHALGDTRGVGISMFHLSIVTRALGDHDRSLRLARDCLALFRTLDDRQWCANVLVSLGMTLFDRRAYSAARDALEEALALFRRLGGARRIAVALGNLGDVARAQGDYERAQKQLLQSLEAFDRLDDAWGSSAALESLAMVACERGHAERAAILLGAADARRQVANAALPSMDRAAHEQAMATLRLRLSSAILQASLDRGRGMARQDTLALARSHADPAPDVRLTERERAVAALVARGSSNQQIAAQLVISKRTAETHVANILKRLGLASRAQLAVWWVSKST